MWSLCFIILIILIFAFDIKISEIKNIKEEGQNTENLKILEDLPSNEIVAKEVLKSINSDAKIEINNNSSTSLYLIMQNKIVIGNVGNIFTRVQTVIHECIHSVQNKKIQKANFIISNISNIYFLIEIILIIFKITDENINKILLEITIAIEFVVFSIRSFLELDAMIRAEYETEKYLNNKTKNKEKIMQKYKKLNKVGIKLYNFSLILKSLIKIFIVILINNIIF